MTLSAVAADMAFSRDDRLIAIAAATRGVRIWDGGSGEPITPPLPGAVDVEALRFTDDDRALTALASNPWNGPVAIRWTLLHEDRGLPYDRVSRLLSLHSIDATGAHVAVNPSELRDLAGVTSLLPADSDSDTGRLVAWRQQQVTLSAHADDRDAATGHLDWLVERQPDAWKPLLNRGAVRQRRTFHYTTFEHSPDWPTVLADYTAAIELAPDEVLPRQLRADAYCDFGDFEAAAADFQKLWQLTAQSEWGWTHALARLATDDIAAYQAQCRELAAALARGATDEEALWVCLIRPDAVIDFTPLVKPAETAVRALEGRLHDREAYRNHAAALLRTGRAAEALPDFQRCLDRWSDYPAAEMWLVMALLHQELGHAQEALEWKNRAQTFLNGEGEDMEWTERTILQALAEQLH
jgi:tetratricopeptide (TPR) repeat protein